ncbi:hypothetical protein ACFWAR_18620 [Streptomyces sp. NPDC059917]|uniref:hypothetical protein n=1 Tax=Streptomyces sp. NPDC059917 TaxID=3347002 RepID=UPI0036525383
MPVTVWNPLSSRARRRNGGWVAVLVTAALVALFFSVCDSGGHHRSPVPTAATTAASAAAAPAALDPAGGCPDGDRPCVRGDEHSAVQLPQRRTADPASELPPSPVDSVAFRPPFDATGRSTAPSAGSGRDLLCRACVSRT